MSTNKIFSRLDIPIERIATNVLADLYEGKKLSMPSTSVGYKIHRARFDKLFKVRRDFTSPHYWIYDPLGPVIRP